MRMGRYDHPEVVMTLLDQSDFKVMPLNHIFERRIKGTATSVSVSCFGSELNQRVLLLHRGIQLVHQATKTVRQYLS